MEAIVADNTEAVFGGIASFNEKGIVTTDGTVHELDVYVSSPSLARIDSLIIPHWNAESSVLQVSTPPSFPTGPSLAGTEST